MAVGLFFLTGLLTLPRAIAQPEVLRFESGLRVVVEHRPETPRTASALLIGVGEQDVAVGQEHVAHLVEHLAFRASPRADAPSHRATLGAWTCDHNGFTWLDKTVLLASCPDDATETSLDVWASILQDPLHNIDDAMVDLELDILAMETEQRRSDRLAIVNAVVANLEPGGRSASRASRAGIGDLDLATAQQLAARAYRPNNAVLAMVTSRPQAELQPHLIARWGPLQTAHARPQGARRPKVAPRNKPVDGLVVPVDIRKPQAVLAFQLPQGLRGDGYLFALLLQVRMSLRLDRQVDCFPSIAGSSQLLVCHLPGDAQVAAKLRAAADVRDLLDSSFLRSTLTTIAQDAQRDAALADQALAPVPWSRPATLAQWMWLHDQPAPRVDPAPPTEAEVREALQHAKKLLDPRHSLTLALTPAPRATALPAARTTPLGVLSFAPAQPPLTASVEMHDDEGFVRVERPDLGVGRWFGVRQAPLWVGPSTDLDPRRELPLDEVRLAQAPTWTGGLPEHIPPPTFELSDQPFATLAWGCVTPGTEDVDALVLGQLLAERVFQQLREQRAWVYSPSTFVLGPRILVTAEVTPAALPEAIRLVVGDVEAIRQQATVPHELATALRRASVHASPALAMDADWATLALGPQGPRAAQELAALPHRIAAVSAHTVAQAARECLATGRFHASGSLEVKRALQAAGLLPDLEIAFPP